jgi:hypothetical protein
MRESLEPPKQSFDDLPLGHQMRILRDKLGENQDVAFNTLTPDEQRKLLQERSALVHKFETCALIRAGVDPEEAGHLAYHLIGEGIHLSTAAQQASPDANIGFGDIRTTTGYDFNALVPSIEAEAS